MTNFEKVHEFHDHFNCGKGQIGHLPSLNRVMLRTRLMMEELAELVESMQLGEYVNVAKELADVLYVVLGTAVEYGLPMDEVFEAVHQSVVIMPHWLAQGDEAGRWSVTMNLSIDTTLAESRMQDKKVASAG